MPTPCIVTGNLQTLSSGQINAGAVRFQLSNIGTGNPVGIIGTSLIPQLVQTFATDNTGAFSCSIWGNDNINPANTVYLVTFLDGLGNSVGPIQYSLTGASVNLNTAVAGNTTSPPVLIGGPAIVSAPLAPQTITGQPLTLTSAPLTLSNPGVFSNAQMNVYLQSLVNGCSPSTEIGGNANATQAITGCVAVPAGTVNNNSAGVAGFATSLADSAGRAHGNAVGGYFQGKAIGANSAAWGINFLAYNQGTASGVNITGFEGDIGVDLGSTPAYVRGGVLALSNGPNGSGTMPVNSIGLEILSIVAPTLQWNRGLQIDDGAASLHAIQIGAVGSGTNVAGMPLAFARWDAGGVRRTTELINVNSVGDLIFTQTGGVSTLLHGMGTGQVLTTGSGAGNLLQTKRTAGCTTSGGATPFTGPCTTTVTWPNTFADGSYTVTCTGNGIGAGVPLLQGTITIIGASTTVQTQQATGVNASFTNIECIAIHD